MLDKRVILILFYLSDWTTRYAWNFSLNYLLLI